MLVLSSTQMDTEKSINLKQEIILTFLAM